MFRRITAVAILILLGTQLWAQANFELTILHTNDTHGMMLPFDYQGVVKYDGKQLGGLARRAALIEKLRKEAKNPVLLLEAGDVFTRGPWHTLTMGKPDFAAMNMMKYDAMCVGNNEFKASLDTRSQTVFRQLMNSSKFPWLAANLTVGNTGVMVPGVKQYIIKKFGSVRVGIIGVTAPRSSEYPQTRGWSISDPIAVAKKLAPQVRRECDILIALTHIGDLMDRLLAEKVPELDAIVGGDSHTFIDPTIMIKRGNRPDLPIVQTGEQGIFLGKLDLKFRNEDGKGWQLVSTHGVLLPVNASITPDAEVAKLLTDMGVK